MAAEVGKGPLMRLQKLRHPLIGTGVIEPATAESQREHEHVHHLRPRAEGHAHLAPINLTLVPRRRLKADERPLCLQLHLA